MHEAGERAGVPLKGRVLSSQDASSPEETVVKLVVDTGTVSTFSLIGLVNLGLLGLS